MNEEPDDDNLICKICNITFTKNSNYVRHLYTSKHTQKVNKNKQIIEKYNKKLQTNKFICNICNFICSKKSNYKKHLCSNKHIAFSEMVSVSDNVINNDTEIEHEFSGNQIIIADNIADKNIELETFKNEILSRFNIMEEQNRTILEMANKPVTTISNNTNISNNNTNISNNNQHFNMNMFLNETCKDAMNFSDFMKNLTVTMEDMELTGQLGFVKGMTRIIVNNLNALDVCKRPIHCSDAKRETLYVKNNGVWEKETDDKEFTKELIRRVRHLSDIQLSKWRYLPKNKGYERYDHYKNSEFLTLVYEIHQFREEEIDKLIRNIIRHVVIDKSLYLR
jgi:hypothetical protein